MIWLPVSLAAFAAAVWATARRARWAPAAGAAGYLALALFIWVQAGAQAFSGSETSLLGFFVGGLVLLAAGEAIAGWGSKRLAAWALAAAPLAALKFSFGFDILRPDPYATIPAAILAAVFAIVAVQAYFRLGVGIKKKTPGAQRWLLAGYVAAVAILLYAALYKTIDRGWLLPTAYGAGTGAVLFAIAQLWLGWERVLRKPAAPAWAQRAALYAGVVLMTVAAFFVYREFL
jgi:hypothetical protein